MNKENRVIKFEVCTRRKDGTDLFTEVLTLDDLLNRNGCYYSPTVQEIVYKRQFTGLTDKNGKDIYEGDIIAYFYEETVIKGHLVSERGYSLNAVIFHNSMFCIGIDNDFALGNWAEDDDLEIMGNIYENPELLTKE